MRLIYARKLDHCSEFDNKNVSKLTEYEMSHRRKRAFEENSETPKKCKK